MNKPVEQWLANRSNPAYITIWLLIIVSCCAVLYSSFVQDNHPYNAGLLTALEIDQPENKAAIALGKNYQNKLLILVGHESLQHAVSIASDIRTNLKAKPWIESIYSNPLNAKFLNNLISYYGQSPLSYLTNKQQQQLKSTITTNQSDALSDGYFALLNQWADPIVSQSIEKDSTLTLAGFLKERLHSNIQGDSHWQFSQQEFMLKGAELSYIPIFISVKPNYINLQDSVVIYQTLQDLRASVQEVLSQSQPDGEILMSGMMLHSASASLQAQQEISSFGLFSLIAVIIVILLVFRSPIPLIACLLVIGSALLVGVTALIIWFESIHILAFVFAVSILGIAVDYGFHILVIRQHSKDSASSIRNKVFVPLTIALVSTIAGYSLFFTTPITLLHQVVVFVGFGLIGAYLTALLVLPAVSFTTTGISFAISPKQTFLYVISAGLVFLISTPTLNFDDNVANLNTKSEHLVQEDLKVAKLTGDNVYPHMVMVQGASQDELLVNTQVLTETLRQQGATLKSIADWQIPLVEQQKNTELIKQAWQQSHYQNIEHYLEINTISNLINQAKPIALAPDFIAMNIGLAIQQLDQTYWTALLLNAPLTNQQATSVKQLSYAKYVNLPRALSTQLTEVRFTVLKVAIPALLIIFIILSIYFGVYSAFIMLLVPSISAGLALSLTQLFQTSLNIFNILACLLIITLAIDYVVFFRAHGVNKSISHTISLSALSSALTFGVMSFSATPAVSSFGLTLLIGITVAWILSHVTPLTYIKNNKLEKHND